MKEKSYFVKIYTNIHINKKSYTIPYNSMSKQHLWIHAFEYFILICRDEVFKHKIEWISMPKLYIRLLPIYLAINDIIWHNF